MDYISCISLVTRTSGFVYDNWVSIFEDLQDALNQQRDIGWFPVDLKQEPQYSSEAAGWVAAHTQKCGKLATRAGKAATEL